jgi:capsular exopolysaccharide synthesis family protein
MAYSEEDVIDISQYLRTLRRRWIPAAIACSSVVAIVAAFTFLQKPVYQAQGKLLLKKESGPTLTDVEELGALEALTQKSSPLDTEAEIMRSAELLQQTVDGLDLRDDEGNLIDVNGENGKNFVKSLSINNIRNTDLLDISFKSTNPTEAAAVVNKLMQVYLRNNIVDNRAEAGAAREFLEKELPKAEAEVRELELAVRLFKEQNQTISLPEELRGAVDISSQFEQQIATIQGQLKAVTVRSQTLQRELNLVPQQGIALNTLSQSPAVQQLLRDLQAIQGQLATAQKQLNSQHPVLLELEEKQVALQALLKQEISQVVDRPITVQSSQIPEGGGGQTNLAGLLAEAEIERLGFVSQLNTLLKTKADFQKRLDSFPKLEQQQRELERKLTVAQATYEALLKNLQATQITENRTIGNARTITNAVVPYEPISPRKGVNLLVGLLLGSMFGVAVALLLEALDNSLKTVKEAKELFTNYTVLATLPLITGTGRKNYRKDLSRPTPRLILREQPQSALSETYRMLQANLKFLSSDRPNKAIVFTSSVPGEGKSTVTANLALALAELGNRVLVVDADLRRPTQHQIWEAPNTVGLSNILAEHIDWAEHVRSEEATLDILPSGTIPPNPVPLLNSHRMNSLIEVFCKHYDYVLIDTPPLAVAADALVIGKLTDGIIVVARPGVATIGAAEGAKDALMKTSQQVLGLVLNGIIPEHEPDSYYYYYYSRDDDTKDTKEQIEVLKNNKMKATK